VTINWQQQWRHVSSINGLVQHSKLMELLHEAIMKAASSLIASWCSATRKNKSINNNQPTFKHGYESDRDSHGKVATGEL